METKLFEVRDRMTFLPVICIRLEPSNEADRYLLAMAGYGLRPETQSEYILMGMLRRPILECAPGDHAGYPTVRTLPTAHQHILKHWDDLQSGEVIDVEYLMGENSHKKVSQRIVGITDKFEGKE